MFFFPYYYGFDWTYFLILIPGIILSVWTNIAVKRTFNKYSNVNCVRSITAEEAANRVLRINGINNILIQRVPGNLTDHYNPKTGTISLSDAVYGSTSIAAIGVACHEAGHAVQYGQGYFPIRIRTVIIPVANFGSTLALPLILIGFLFSYAGNLFNIFVYLGIGCFSLSLLFQLITLPVEFNASRRALHAIDHLQILTEEERVGAKKTLSAAAMTYVAAVVVSLTQLLRLFLLISSGGRRRNH